MKLYKNHSFIDLKDDNIIKKLDYSFQDSQFIVKQFKSELAKIELLDDNVKNALENISNMQELQLEQIKLYEQLKHAILKKYDISVYSFKFRQTSIT